MDTLLTISAHDDADLIKWLSSNPVADRCDTNVPTFVLRCDTLQKVNGEIRRTGLGMLRWPVVPGAHEDEASDAR